MRVEVPFLIFLLKVNFFSKVEVSLEDVLDVVEFPYVLKIHVFHGSFGPILHWYIFREPKPKGREPVP